MTGEQGAAPARPDAPLLLLTKLHPPLVPTQTVARERLFGRLREGRGRRLSLLAGPAGFGKSTLLAAWREAELERRPVAWVTLDERDGDDVVLWSHVIEALARVCPGLDGPGLLASAAVAPPLEVVLPRLVNALVEEGEVVLVLDDFHRLGGAAALATVAWFVEHLPATLQLVISSRVDPALPLATLRAQRQLLELRADALRFTVAEAGEFLTERLGLALAPAEVALLVERTEGWPAGLYLAALSLAGAADLGARVRAFDGTSAHVVDFLAGEVLAGYPPELQRFMVRTAVLERLRADLCDALLGEPGSAAALGTLTRSNLFLAPLDGDGRWFRFHHLFARILRLELERGEPALVPELHRRAHRWHRAHGTTDEAIDHALAGGLFDEAAELISESWVHYANSGRTASVLGWLTRFPQELLDGNRRLLLVKAWVVALRGREREMHALVARLRELGGLDDGPQPDGTASLESSLALLDATFAWGDVGKVLRQGTRAIELEGPDSIWYPVLTWAIGWAHLCNDELEPAERRLRETVALGPRAEQWIVVTASLADLSLIAGIRGQPAEQARLAEEAAAMAREHGLLDSVEVGEVHTARGVVLAAAGDHDGALRELEQGVKLRRLWAQQLDLVDGLIALAAQLAAGGEREAADERFAEAEAIVAGCPDPGALPRRLAAARRAAGIARGGRGGRGEALSPRELEVLRLLAGGRSERAIAGELFLSFNTVHTHVRTIYRKLAVSSRAAALTRARELGLISPR